MTTIDAVQVAQERAAELKREYLELEAAYAEAQRQWTDTLNAARKRWHKARDEVAVVSERLRQLGGG